MRCVTFQYRPSRRITIHKHSCGHLLKHGGHCGGYRGFNSYDEAHEYAEMTELPIVECRCIRNKTI